METVQVFVRFRAEDGEPAAWTLSDYTVTDNSQAHTYTFDRIFGRNTSQTDVFDLAARDLVAAL